MAVTDALRPSISPRLSGRRLLSELIDPLRIAFFCAVPRLRRGLALIYAIDVQYVMLIIETPIFTRRILELISDEEYRLLQNHLVNTPDVGKIITGSGGLRKVRWSAGGHGKRGGIRAIYYWFVNKDVILFLYAYPKNEKDNLTMEQRKQLKNIVEEEYL